MTNVTNYVANTLVVKNDIVNMFVMEIVPYAIIASIISYGIIESIKSVNKKLKEDNNILPYVSLGIVYLMGMIFGLFLSGLSHPFQKIVFGLTIASASVASYKFAIQGFLEIVPAVMSKIKNIIAK